MNKKVAKNQIKLEPDFFRLTIDEQKSNIIDLYETNEDCIIEKDKEKIINKINSLKNELNHVNNLIHYIEEKLLLYENNNNFILDNNSNINNPENNKNIINNKAKITYKNLFSVVNTENKNHEKTKFNYTKKNMKQKKLIHHDEITNKKDNNEKDNSFITSDIKEKKDLSQVDDDVNSFFNLNEFFGICADKNDINFENKNNMRKNSEVSNCSIDGKINRFNYDKDIFL